MNLLKVDFTIQCILIFISLVLFRNFGFIVFYFGLGSYQLVTHFIKWFSGYRNIFRKIYNFCLWVVLMGSFIWINYYKSTPHSKTKFSFEAPPEYLLTMLVVGPILALLHLAATIQDFSITDTEL